VVTAALPTPTAPPRVLLVEDNEELAFGLRRTLEAHGYHVVVEATGEGALVALGRVAPHLVILDLTLPGLDGFGVLERLRQAGGTMPVLILSARGEEADKVRGFRTGADDFVTKPFGVRELVERVAALLRRATRADGDRVDAVTLRCGDVEIDTAGRRALRDGRVIPLTPREFDLLLALVQQPGVALSRATLLRDVWGHAPDIQTRTVDLHVAELRRKLEPVPAAPRHIVTVFKTGYRFDP
jgi:two-component system response regulator MtrA